MVRGFLICLLIIFLVPFDTMARIINLGEGGGCRYLLGKSKFLVWGVMSFILCVV